MDRIEIGIIGTVAALLLIGLRMPIGIALGSVAFIGVWALTNMKAALGMLTAIPYAFVSNWSFSAVPMFLLMGYIASEAGLTGGLFRAMRICLWRVPGGLASATVGASALFASASGSSVATAAAMSRITIPEMLRARYDPGLASGAVAVAGTLGSMIPPSILMIIYGVFTQQSVGKLFVAGVIPGLLTAFVFVALITVRAMLDPKLAPRGEERYTLADMRDALLDIWPLPVLVAGIMGGIFLGVFTPTEAAAVGASLALVLALLRRGLSWRNMNMSLFHTAVGTCVIFVIAMGSAMFARFLGLTQLPNEAADALLAISTSPLFIVLVAAIIYIVLGMFIDSIGIMLLTLPMLMPLLSDANIDFIWFGILVVKLLEIGLITPPVGLNVFVVHSSVREHLTLSQAFKGTLWFLAADLFTLGLLIAFPILTTWLPGLMSN